MPRNMSFSATTAQIMDRSKTVTRRKGWLFLERGDRLWAVRKAMGLKRGEKVERLALIEVIRADRERLWDIGAGEVIREGFPDLSPPEFCALYCQMNGGDHRQWCTRIEFAYIDEQTP